MVSVHLLDRARSAKLSCCQPAATQPCSNKPRVYVNRDLRINYREYLAALQIAAKIARKQRSLY